MDVRMAEQQILLIADRIGPEEADARAHSKRNDAFGTMAKLTGFLAKIGPQGRKGMTYADTVVLVKVDPV